MQKLKFERCEYDAYFYLRKERSGNMIYLLLYVNDVLLASKEMKDLVHFKTLLKSEFEMKDMRSAKKILGMELKR